MGKERFGRSGKELPGAQIAAHAAAIVAAKPHAHEARPANLVAPREHAPPRAAVLGHKAHELQVELLAEASDQARHGVERIGLEGELHLRGRALRIATAVPEDAEARAFAAQAVEERLGDVAAVVHHAGLRTVPTTRALLKLSSSRRRASADFLVEKVATTSAPPAKAAESCRSGPRAAAGVSISTTR